jgi:hypothetical protein
VDIDIPPSSTQACYINEAGTSKNPDTLILQNHETSKGIQEISISYTSSEVYDDDTTIVNSYFSIIIAKRVHADLDPKTIAECKKHSDWNEWKEVIEAELYSLKKGKVFTDVIPTTPEIFPIGFKLVFIRKRNENSEVVRYKARLVA